MKAQPSVNKLIRSLHRDIGFLVLGLTLIYAFSGIILTYRETSFLKSETTVERTIEPNLQVNELGKELHNKRIKPISEEGDLIYFKNGEYDGTYNKKTGYTKYRSQELPAFLRELNGLHKTATKGTTHWFTTLYGILLLFLALSSFWMFKPGTKFFKRGIRFTFVGLLGSILLLAF